RRDGLCGSRFAHEAERVPGMDLEGDAVHGAGGAAALLGDEIRLEVAHAEQGLGHAAPPSRRGSRASRSPSAMPLSAMTTTAMARPGKTDVQGATAIFSVPSHNMLPQHGA